MTQRSIRSTTVVAGVFLFLTAPVAFAQQTKGQQNCLNNVNKAGGNVAKQQGKQNSACLRDAGKNKLVAMTAQDCLTADVKGKVQKKKDKTVAAAAKHCTTPPAFGFTGAANTNFSAEQAELDLVADAFGAGLDAAVISCDANKDGCGCQQKVLKDVEKLAAKKVAEFVKCKKAALKAGASSSMALANCVDDAGTPGSIAADTKGKLSKAQANLNKSITKKCDEKGVTAGAFPGKCDTLAGTALGTCLDVQVECRVCQMINDIDGIFVDCDTFDDGAVNASCASGTGPVPTPTPVPGGTVFKKALLKSNGLFTYSAMAGLAGADFTCNSNFAGSHACTFSELQTAEGLGELVGAQDLSGNSVTSFWVIDAGQANNRQCVDGGAVVWHYATAHTGVGGMTVTLNNGTGALGSVVGGPPGGVSLNCTQQHWVGCCL